MSGENFIVAGAAFRDPETGVVQQVPSIGWFWQAFAIHTSNEFVMQTMHAILTDRPNETVDDVPVRPINISVLLYLALKYQNRDIARYLLTLPVTSRYTYVKGDEYLLKLEASRQGYLEILEALDNCFFVPGIPYLPTLLLFSDDSPNALTCFRHDFMSEGSRRFGPQNIGLFFELASKEKQLDMLSYLVSEPVRKRHYVLEEECLEILCAIAKTNHEESFLVLIRLLDSRPEQVRKKFWNRPDALISIIARKSMLAPVQSFAIIAYFLEHHADKTETQNLAMTATGINNPIYLEYILHHRKEPYCAKELEDLLLCNETPHTSNYCRNHREFAPPCDLCAENHSKISEILRLYAVKKGISLSAKS